MRGITAFNPRSAFFVMLLVVAACSMAGQSGRTYSLTASDDWMPYSSSKDPNGGILVMIAKAAFGASGRDAAVTLLPWNRALEEARAGSQMGIIGAWYSEERAKDFLYSDPIMKNEIALFVFSDRGIRYDKLEEFVRIHDRSRAGQQLHRKTEGSRANFGLRERLRDQF